eukprot:2294688-Prymnesium_polylepis.1
MGPHGARALCDALEENQCLTALNLEGNALEGSDAAFYNRQLLDAALTANQRRMEYRALLGDTTPASRLRLHVVGGVAAGKTTLIANLGKGGGENQKKLTRAADGDGADAPIVATRGVEVRYERYEGRSVTLWEYGGAEEFQLAHWRVYDRELALGLPEHGAPAVYVVVVSLELGLERCAAELRSWRRLIRCVLPPGAAPPLVVVGTHADALAKTATSALHALRTAAEQDTAMGLLPPVTACQAHDARTPCWPLRDWVVGRHDAAMA